jgi:hypothetical protein
VLPTDQATREYLCYLADKIRNQTTGHKYVGLLPNDAKRLGVKLDRMNEILNSSNGITSIARELFKTMVPEDDRQVDHWNKLPESVLLKEKVMIGTSSSLSSLKESCSSRFPFLIQNFWVDTLVFSKRTQSRFMSVLSAIFVTIVEYRKSDNKNQTILITVTPILSVFNNFTKRLMKMTTFDFE